MRSEKLKQLVKDKVPLKFRIKNEKQFKELREFMYALDVFLKGETFDYLDKDILAEGGEAFYLFSSIDDFEKYSMSICVRNHDGCCFSKKEAKEFDIINDRIIQECKWSNLKKLVEDKTVLGFVVKDEKQGQEIQEFLFSLDVGWHFGAKEMMVLAGRNLICAFKNKTYCMYCDDNPGFLRYDPKEFDFENDRLIEEEEKTRTTTEYSLYEREMLEQVSKILTNIKEDRESRKELWTRHPCCSDNTGVGSQTRYTWRDGNAPYPFHTY
ncbi:hypothetical protein LCGC14_2115400 [marine sediment metagenome]|uniref:Uncharacterized protein n=1 Tax=marine sediment metagenome TaxID=412755 RepID=A0A0F9GIX7_9ZZZZ